ncbi:MAG: CDP-glucose 4,6-dehydratase [Parachlamydiales bacterium]|nr:CDP-glucose 4,6-dehydratase [Parachlamydiales bacterium]
MKHIGKSGKMTLNKSFWKNKRVLITGHTGFKGTWLIFLLHELGAEIGGYSQSVTSERPLFYTTVRASSLIKNNFSGDICDLEALKKSLREFKPDIVFHLAAQPLVRTGYQNPLNTFKINTIGTVSLLEAIRLEQKSCTVINVTTDKVYRNIQKKDAFYREADPIGGKDPYSASKAGSEIASYCYRNSFFNALGIGLATARAGNVIGGGDFSPDRLIPDTIEALAHNRPIILRSPSSIRPWQHVLNVLSGYLILAEKLHGDIQYGDAYNFGPSKDETLSVSQLIEQMIQLWGGKHEWKPADKQEYFEEPYLALDSSKARQELGWFSTWDLKQTLTDLILWYKAFEEKRDMHSTTKEHVIKFIEWRKD